MSQITFGSIFVMAILLFMTSCATSSNRTQRAPAYNKDALFEKELKRLLVLTENLNETVVVKSYEM